MAQIRRGEPSDLPGIADVQAASPEASAWPVADYLRYDLRVATDGGCIVGFIAARRTAEDEREILNLAVAPDCRRKGVARALVGSVLHGDRGSVYLEVRSSNSGARTFYKSVGFQEVTIRKEYYDEPPESAIVMKFHSC